MLNRLLNCSYYSVALRRQGGTLQLALFSGEVALGLRYMHIARLVNIYFLNDTNYRSPAPVEQMRTERMARR